MNRGDDIMLMVSKIKVHPKKGQTYLLELVDQQSSEVASEIEVHEDLIVKYQLSKGMPLSDQKVRELDSENQAHHVYQSALNYISYRMRSQKEVRDYLKGKDFSESLIQSIIEKLKKANFLDDQAFGDAFVRSRMHLSSKGPAVIRKELIQKGLVEPQVDQALEQYSEEAQLEQAQIFAKKKRASYHGRSEKEILQKLRQALMQKGFPSRMISVVLEELADEEQSESEEWAALKKQGEKALKKYRAFSGYEKKMKLKQFLYRKGFQSDHIEKWLGHALED